MISIAYFALDLYLASRAPTLEQWQAAAEVVRLEWREGDTVVFAPQWAQEGAPFFAGLNPVTGEAVDWYELQKRGRVWSVGFRGAIPEGIFGLSEVERLDLEKVTVRLYEPEPTRPKLLYDFRVRLEDARVTRVHKDRREDCEVWRDEAWHCGTPHPWQNVGRRRMDAGGTIRDVIWAHPLDKGEPLEVRWPAVLFGKRLVVHYGYGQRAVDSENKVEPVTFKVRVGEETVIVATLDVLDNVWHEEVIDTSGRAGQRGEVVFTVTAPDHRDRYFGFTADSWE